MSTRLDLDAALRVHLRAIDEPDLPSVGVEAMLGAILAHPQHAPRGGSWRSAVSFPSRSSGLRVGSAVGLLLALLVGAGLLAGQQPAPSVPTRTYRNVVTPAGPLVVGRYHHAAARLADGRVLVLGGNMSDTSGNSAELFDPRTGTFTATSSMAYWRADPTATLLADGRVLVVGGFGSDPDVAQTAELFDPSTATWSMAGRLAVPRIGHTATLLPDGRVLIAGGAGQTDNPTQSAELFDRTADRFVPAGDMTVPRSGHTATLLLDGSVLLAGGHIAGDPDWEVTASADLFDPVTRTFRPTGPMITAAAYRSAALLHDGRVLILEGISPRSSDTDYLRDAEVYDPGSGAFTGTGRTADDHLGATGQWAITLDDGSVLVVGSPSQRFDPTTDTFELTGETTVDPGPAVLTLLADGRVLMTGGSCRGGGGCLRAQIYE